MANKEYSSSDIQTLRFPDSLRMNPGVYIGAVDSDGYWLVVRECLDNGLDEFLAGRNTGVALVEADDGSYYVYDQGFGIPQGTKTFEINVNGQTITSKMPVMQAVFSELHTSGKYRSDAYKTSVGCFVGETKIKLLDGTEPTFEELYNRWQKDQSPIPVYTWDVEKDQAAFSNISHVQLTKYTDELVDVTLDSGKTIRCTPNHPFYVRTIRGIKKVHAEKLTPDMSLVSMRVDTDESGYMSSHDLTRNGFSKERVLHTEESYEQSRACCHPNWLRGVEAIKRANGCKTIEEVKSFVDNYNHRIVSVKRVKLDKPVPVYDLTVDGTHTYFVDEALVSNSHGMGVKATNALSEFFTATTCYKGRWYTIGFERGVLTQPLKQTTAPKFQGKTLKKGTLIHLKHDNKIFKNDKRLDFERAKSWAEITTYLNPGFTVVIKDKDGNTFKYKSQEGAKEFVQKILTDLKAQAEPEVFEFKNELADVVVSFSSAEGCNVRGYTNGLFNSDGGKHVDSVVNALFSACKPFAKAKQTLSLYDFKEGLVGIVNMHLHKAEFSSQDKLKLTDNRAGAEFQSVLEKHASAFFKKNKVLAQKLCERASKLSELRNQFKASKKMITALNAAKKKGMPAKYAPFDSRSKLEDRELLIVEGDSAAGGLREVRYSYQSLMPLRGKIANIAKNPNFVYTSEEIINILSAIGYDPKLEDPLSKVQIGRMICLADGDEDGCFEMLQRVLLCNGTSKTFEELAKQWEKDKTPIWVWSLDAQGNLHPAKAFDPSIRCYREKEVHVYLDSGDEIVCTMKHPFAVNYCSSKESYIDDNGVKYLEAQYLKPGDSIMSAYFKDMPLNGNKGNKNLYKHVQTKNTYSWSGNYYPLHKLVAAEAYPEAYEDYCAKNKKNKNSMAIHHKDHNRMNNTPSNLEIITSLEHAKDHHSFNKIGYNGSELQKQKLKEYHQSERYINTELQKARQRRIDYNKTEKNRETTAAINKREDVKLLQQIGKYARAVLKLKACGLKANSETINNVLCSNGAMLYYFDKYFILANLADIKDKVKELSSKRIADKRLYSYIVKDDICINACVSTIQQLIREDRFSEEAYDKIAMSDSTGVLCKYSLFNKYIKRMHKISAVDYAKQSFNNHKVVKVEIKELKEPKPFYCLTVPKYHNFLLADKNGNGICSSNCHINTLLLTLIFKVAPELFEKGMVYIADMPDFYATYKDQVAVGNSVSEVRQKLNAMKAPKSVEINHIKGWGEIDSSLMKALAVDKATRKLIKIKALTDHDRVTFIRIMNDDVAYRRQMLGLSENV